MQRGGAENVDVEEVAGTDNKSNVTLIQDRINQNLSEEIQSKLGQPYFRNIRFSLGPVELPGVQQAIDQAQSAFAEVSRAQARVAQAKADADANEERQRGYNNCPACQRIDAIKALPPGLTALGRGLHDGRCDEGGRGARSSSPCWSRSPCWVARLAAFAARGAQAGAVGAARGVGRLGDDACSAVKPGQQPLDRRAACRSTTEDFDSQLFEAPRREGPRSGERA